MLGQREKLARAEFLVRNRFDGDEFLTDEIFEVRLHAIALPAVGKFRKIFPSDRAEFPEFYHCCNFGASQPVGSPADFVNDARCGALRLPGWLVPSIA